MYSARPRPRAWSTPSAATFKAGTGGLSLTAGRKGTSITVEIVSPGPSRATIEARPERAADRAPAHGRTSLPPRGPVGCCRRGTRRPRRLIGKCRAGAAAGNVSAEGEAIRSNDYRKDTTVKAPSTRPAAVLGLDVGKSSHWACLGEELRHVGEVGQGVQARRREAQVPADLLVQQPGEVLGALRRVLPGLQGAGHGTRAGAQGRREEAAQGDIRRDARPGALPGVAPTVDKTIGTPNCQLPDLSPLHQNGAD